MKILKIAISPCPNDIFIFSGLILNKVLLSNFKLDFYFEDIQTLNNLYLDEKSNYDVIKISAILTNKNPKYKLLNNGGAMGFDCGPLLLSQTQKKLNPTLPVLLPGKDTTAHALFEFYSQNNPLLKNKTWGKKIFNL